jgi:hypothetical protein
MRSDSLRNGSAATYLNTLHDVYLPKNSSCPDGQPCSLYHAESRIVNVLEALIHVLLTQVLTSFCVDRTTETRAALLGLRFRRQEHSYWR